MSFYLGIAGIPQVVTLSDASVDALATALENKRRGIKASKFSLSNLFTCGFLERTSVVPTPLHPAEEVQEAANLRIEEMVSFFSSVERRQIWTLNDI